MAGKATHSYGQIENYGSFNAVATDKDGAITQSELDESIIIKSANNAVYYNFNEVVEQSQKVKVEVK
jgi:hypothetical protein